MLGLHTHAGKQLKCRLGALKDWTGTQRRNGWNNSHTVTSILMNIQTLSEHQHIKELKGEMGGTILTR